MGTKENLLIYETGGNNVLVAISGVLIGRGSQDVIFYIEVEIERILKIYQMDGKLLLIFNLY